jgi:XRE family aerobic/anaerobic benzoate catabolism transcriptional regulator
MLSIVGARLRERRLARGLTQARLAAQAGVSPRFLSQIEGGDGNVSVARLVDLCTVLELPLSQLFRGLGPGGSQKVSLVGLRGAGKSAVGARLAARRGCPFIELDQRVEALAGMGLGEIFEIRGAAAYRALEARALEEALGAPGPAVIATGGSLVTRPDAWRRLRELSRTAWLMAPPEAHLQRVLDQGDLRPMRGRPDALAELREILSARAPLYGEADLALDTAPLGVDGVVEALERWLDGR